ncbi:MAG: acyl carrier protein [Terriglobia bacterium]
MDTQKETTRKRMSDGDLSVIVEIICRTGGIENLRPAQDFYDAGVSSVNALPILMEMEDRFQVSIPDERFMNARTADAIHEVLLDLKKG